MTLLRWALILAIIAIIAGVLGFTNIAGASWATTTGDGTTFCSPPCVSSWIDPRPPVIPAIGSASGASNMQCAGSPAPMGMVSDGAPVWVATVTAPAASTSAFQSLPATGAGARFAFSRASAACRSASLAMAGPGAAAAAGFGEAGVA